MTSRAREFSELATAYDSGGGLNFRNRIINGACEIAQRGPVTASSGTVYGGPDRYRMSPNGLGGSYTQSQSTITFEGRPRKAVRITVDSPATDLTGVKRHEGVTQYIEGHMIQDLVGSPLAVSFIFNTNVSGTYGMRVGTGGSGYLRSFNAVANTPQRLTFIVPAMPDLTTFGNAAPDNGAYLRVQIGYINFGTLIGSETSEWALDAPSTATGSVNWAATSGNFIELTELQLEAGSVATPFERRPYGTELSLCQRYFYKYPNEVAWGVQVVALGSTYARTKFEFKVSMRATPSIAGVSYNSTGSSSGAQFVSTDSVTLFANPSLGGQGVFAGNWTASAEL